MDYRCDKLHGRAHLIANKHPLNLIQPRDNLDMTSETFPTEPSKVFLDWLVYKNNSRISIYNMKNVQPETI